MIGISSQLRTESTGCPTYITKRRALMDTIENIDNNLLDLSEPVLIKNFFLTVIHLIQMLIQMFSTQILNMFYLLKIRRTTFSMKLINFQTRFCIYCNSYLFIFYYCRFFLFFLFLSTFRILGTW